MNRGINYRKRIAHPSDRHDRNREARRKRTVWNTEVVKVTEKDKVPAVNHMVEDDTAFDWTEIDETLERTAAQETLDEKTVQDLFAKERSTEKKHDAGATASTHRILTRREEKKERKWQAREAEIDALINRRQYGIKGLLLHPYKCMVNEFYEEIPGSLIGSLVRMFVKWLICGAFFAEEIKKMIDAGSFSYLRMNFTTTAEMGFRVTLMLCAAELILYGLHCILSLFSHRRISFHRVLSSGTMCWLLEAIGYLIAGLFGLKGDPVMGLLLLFSVMLIGLMLKNQALIDGTSLSHELVTVISVLVVFLCGVVIVRVIGLTETEIIQMLVEMYS